MGIQGPDDPTLGDGGWSCTLQTDDGFLFPEPLVCRTLGDLIYGRVFHSPHGALRGVDFFPVIRTQGGGVDAAFGGLRWGPGPVLPSSG